MNHLGEIISLTVAVSWTVTALCADKASHRLGAMTANVLRLVMAVLFLGVILWITVGYPYPVYAGGKAWLWLSLSTLVGYVFAVARANNCGIKNIAYLCSPKIEGIRPKKKGEQAPANEKGKMPY